MSGAPIKIGLVVIGMTAALVVIGMMAAVIDTTESPAWGESVTAGTKKCDSDMKTCRDRCVDGYKKHTQRYRVCLERCVDANIKCIAKAPIPPTKAGQDIGKASGVKKDPMNVQPVIQSDSGNSTTPKTKNVGKVGGVTNVWESQGSQSTSGGTILMKRSGSGKKH